MVNATRASRTRKWATDGNEFDPEPSVPQPWYDRALQVGGQLLDPVTGEPSIHGFSRASGLNHMTIVRIFKKDYGRRGPDASTVAKFAEALDVPSDAVAKWLGVGLAPEDKWEPPKAAEYLSVRDGKYVTQLILRLTEEARQGRSLPGDELDDTDGVEVEVPASKPKAVKVARRPAKTTGAGRKRA